MRRLALLLMVAVGVAGCGGGHGGGSSSSASKTTTVQTTKVVQSKGVDTAFDAEGIYAREAPGVVTIFTAGRDGGLGSGFVLNGRGEIATNAHVVTSGEGSSRKAVKAVYVEFADGNRVPAKIKGFDPDADVALVKVDPSGLDLHPLPLGDSEKVRVGAPVAAIGSPFGEQQSLSVGIVSATDRNVQSLTDFQIAGAIQTDAAINPGNSGGPLVDGRGRVLGLNQQIESESGGGAGVGFAVPIDLAKRSLSELREQGHVDYAYLGVSTVDLYPQLAEKYDLPVKAGAWVQKVSGDGPSEDAGLKAGTGGEEHFQAQAVIPGGDVIVRIAGQPISDPDDLGRVVGQLTPGQTVPVVIYRGQVKKTLRVKLAKRPEHPG